MKRTLLSICLALMACPIFAQVYIRANVGYNLPMSSELLGTNDHYDGSTETRKGVYGSFGSGFSGNVAFGGSLGNGMLGYDLEVGYLTSKKYKSSDSYAFQDYEGKTEFTSKAQSIQFTPSLSFTAGTGKFQPFARMGPVLAITTLKQDQDGSGTDQTSYHYTYKYTGGLSLGFKGALGVNYSLNDNLQLFTEMNFISMSYSARKREITEYTEDGEDRLDDIDEDDRTIDIEKEVEGEGEGGFPPTRDSVSMGSVGLQFGVRFTF
jgi:hypothetical protein